MKNRAFTLIELIIAIVIIGIILPTIARVIYVASKADDEEVKQCVIFETYKRMNRNYSAKWDDESNASSGWAKIVNVANGDSELGFPSKGKRVGSVKGDTGKHRQHGYSHNASDILGLEI
ncbi:MAG: prepilin-type N-terminal cleavage/methylation domain-containing protein, partial [Campylobacterota bacterium]|nr:prepilin-type N-terminal cleavage/methylation domain-containing protein [Campylobacterota bacterium]